MHNIVTYSGRLVFLDLASGAAAPGGLAGCLYHLFTNNFTPLVSSVVGDFTEATFAGYAAQAAVGWGPASLDPSNLGFTQSLPVGWTNEDVSDVDLYGFFVTDAITLDLLFAARFDMTPQPLAVGQTISLQPSFYSDSIYTS